MATRSAGRLTWDALGLRLTGIKDNFQMFIIYEGLLKAKVWRWHWANFFLKKKIARKMDQLWYSHDSESMGNRLLAYTGIISEINLPDRVQLATKLEHFVGSLPKISGRFLSKAYVKSLNILPYIGTFLFNMNMPCIFSPPLWIPPLGRARDPGERPCVSETLWEQ